MDSREVEKSKDHEVKCWVSDSIWHYFTIIPVLLVARLTFNLLERITNEIRMNYASH